MINEYNEALVLNFVKARKEMEFRDEMLKKAYSDLDEAFKSYKEKVLKSMEEES